MNTTNPRPMSRRYIEEHHVLTRYLAGQLSESEREAFETYYVEHPQMLQELEVAAKFKLGMALLDDAGELAEPPRVSGLPRLAAAAVLLGLIAAATWFTASRPDPLLAASPSQLTGVDAAPLPADTYTIERTRSRGFDARVELPAPLRPLALRVLPEQPSTTTYQLQLRVNSTGAPRAIATLRSLRADAEGLVTVYVNSQRLQPGSYEIVLSADSDRKAAASSFLIQVSAAARRQ